MDRAPGRGSVTLLAGQVMSPLCPPLPQHRSPALLSLRCVQRGHDELGRLPGA